MSRENIFKCAWLLNGNLHNRWTPSTALHQRNAALLQLGFHVSSQTSSYFWHEYTLYHKTTHYCLLLILYCFRGALLHHSWRHTSWTYRSDGFSPSCPCTLTPQMLKRKPGEGNRYPRLSWCHLTQSKQRSVFLHRYVKHRSRRARPHLLRYLSAARKPSVTTPPGQCQQKSVWVVHWADADRGREAWMKPNAPTAYQDHLANNEDLAPEMQRVVQFHARLTRMITCDNLIY